MLRKIPVEVITVLLIFLFVYTAISKMVDSNTFGKQLYNHPLPHRFTGHLVWLIPLIELITAGLLTISSTRLYGLLFSVILMTVFTVYVGLISFGVFSKIPCSCGGVIASMSWTGHLVFNIIFLLLAIVGLLKLRQVKSINDIQVR